MGIFKDDKEREYVIELLPRTINRVRMITRNHIDVNGDVVFEKEINLFECFSNGDLARLDDPYLRSIVVYHLCNENVKQYNISEGEFLDSILSSKTMKSVEVAFLEAVSDFFPDQAEAVKRMIEAQETIANAVTSVIDRISGKAKIAMDALTPETLDKIVTVISENDPVKLSSMNLQELQELIRNE
jgi:hypothetical protein